MLLEVGTKLDMLLTHLDVLERQRIAADNQWGQLTRSTPDSDGVMRGLSLPEDDPLVIMMAAIADQNYDLEEQIIKLVQKSIKHHPLHEWQKAQKGVGEKQFARLLGAIGDPYWHFNENRSRSLGELRSYCGLGDAAKQRRRKGQKMNWDPKAKMRVLRIANKVIECGNPRYRAIYDERRAATEGRLHNRECPQCKGSSKPGQPWRPGHRRSDALRIVGKAILEDLWIEARRLHEEAEGK